MADSGGSVLEEFVVKVGLMFSKEKAEEAQAAMKKLGDELRHTAFEAAAAATALFAIGNNFTANAREIEEQSDMLGIGIEKLQDWEYAAKVAANVNREELAGSFQHLGDMMDRARAGDAEARQALLQLAHAGIGEQAMLQKLNDKTYTSADAMKDLSSGFQNIAKQSPQAAARLAEFAFGNAKLLPLLKQGPGAIDNLLKEGHKNFTLNEKMIKQGAEMDRQMTRIWLTLRKFAYEIGFNVMKHMGPMIQQFIKWFGANKALIASGITGFLDELANVMKTLFEIATSIWEVFVKVSEVFGGVSNTIRLIVEAFVAFKAITFVIGIFEALAAVGPILSAAFGLVLPIFEGMAAALGLISAPVLAVVAGIAAAVVALHDAWEIYQAMKGGASFGDAFKGTWTGKGIEKVKNLFGGGEKNAAEGTSALPSGGSSGGEVNQNNTINTTMNVSVPRGTTPENAAGIVSKAAVDHHEKVLIKAKMNAVGNQSS